MPDAKEEKDPGKKGRKTRLAATDRWQPQTPKAGRWSGGGWVKVYNLGTTKYTKIEKGIVWGLLGEEGPKRPDLRKETLQEDEDISGPIDTDSALPGS